MKVNFEIQENYALEFNKRHIDMHNNFDFISFTYDNNKKTISLRWEQTIGDWVKPDEFNKVFLIHTSVSYFNFQKDEESYGTDDLCLANLSYFPSNLRNMNDSIVDQRLPNSEDDIIYQFENGWFIRIKAEEIELVTE